MKIRQRKFQYNNDLTYKENYWEYLNSLSWRIRRGRALAKANYTCSKCNAGHDLCVHHKTYENVFKEKQKDLQVLCEDCHRKIHKLRDLMEELVFCKIENRKSKVKRPRIIL